MVRIIAAVGGKIERDREALLAGGEVAAIERVGIFCRGEPGILPDGPRLVDIHGGIGAAQIRRDARPGFEEIDAFEIGLAVARLYQDSFRREPRFGAAGRRRGGGLFEGDIRKIRYAAHYFFSNCRWCSINLSRFLL